MPRALTATEREEYLAQPDIGVGRYLPEDAARGFAESETAAPTGTFVLFTARPDRWLSTDFGEG